MSTIILIGLAIALIVVFVLDAWCNSRSSKIEDIQIKKMKSWVESLRQANLKIEELGFSAAVKTGTVLLVNGVVNFIPVDDESDVIEEALEKFNIHSFGEEIALYVHGSENLAFLMLKKGQQVTNYVFEK